MPVQRWRLWARQAITVQAQLAAKLPEGKWASAWSLRSRIASSTSACWRCSRSTVVHVLCAVGDEGEVAPVGKELGLLLLGVQVDAADDQPLAPERGLGELRRCPSSG